MRFARYSPSLTQQARERGEFRDKRSRISLRPDGSIFLKLGKLDWEIQFLRVVERDKWTCRCGTRLDEVSADVDHILSRGKGGDDSLTNLQLLGNSLSACQCHLSKHVQVKFGPKHDVKLFAPAGQRKVNFK